MFALTILLVQANARRTIREYTLRGQLVSDFHHILLSFFGINLWIRTSLKMSSLTHSEVEKLTYILLHKSQQVLSLMHKVENHYGLHSVNFLISFFHLIQHGKLGFPFPYIFLIVLHRLYFLVKIIADDVAELPDGLKRF